MQLVKVQSAGQPCIVWCRYSGPAEDLGLDFTVEDETFGGRVVRDLLDNGSEITVTSANKMHYLLLVADWHLNGRLGASSGSFASGLAQVHTPCLPDMSTQKPEKTNHDPKCFIVSYDHQLSIKKQQLIPACCQVHPLQVIAG